MGGLTTEPPGEALPTGGSSNFQGIVDEADFPGVLRLAVQLVRRST
ncbi:hypothetical protein SAMN05216345_11439 [Cupriavidus sp. YR651]|nr:hypothetical protein SAMN05216345_11439 [Cupriavidus sp. YR651]